MFFQPSKRVKTTVKRPILTGFPGLQLNMSIDHMQLLGAFVMMNLSRQPGFKQQMDEMMEFLQQMQTATEAIAVQMESVQTEFHKIKAKTAERQTAYTELSPVTNQKYVNPILQTLVRFMH